MLAPSTNAPHLLLPVGLSLLAAGCGPAPASATAWAAVGAPASNAAVDTGPDTKAAEALSPPPVTPKAPPVAPSAPAAAPEGTLFTYRGTLGGARVLLRLTCAAACAGYYVSEDSGEVVTLRPADGGAFDAVVGFGDRAAVRAHLTFDAPPGKPSWRGHAVGTGAGSAPPVTGLVTLKRVVPGAHPAFVRRLLEDGSPKDAGCVVKVASVELVGLRDPLMEWRINQAIAPEAIAHAHLRTAPPDDDEKGEFDDSTRGAHIHCRMATEQTGGCYLKATASVVMLDDHLASLSLESDDGAGGAHPEVLVAGATLDLATGEVLDARDVLADPAKEPVWSDLLTATPDLVKALASSDKVEVHYGTGGAGTRAFAWSAWPWKTFYLTAAGLAFPPGVDEFHKPLRKYVQTVLYARARPHLRADGPAAYLWTKKKR